jgi:RNA polymerase sigma factor (sigma-70 family)
VLGRMADNASHAKLTEHLVGLRRYAWSLTRCRHEAEDLVQECLARAFAGADTLRPGAPLRPWLFQILRNLHLSGRRRQAVHDAGRAVLQVEEAHEPSQFGHVELQRVLAALDRLPPGQREAIVLIAVEELSYEEAASVLGIPTGTLMSRLSRGREALRRMLDEQPAPRLYVIGGKNAARA